MYIYIYPYAHILYQYPLFKYPHTPVQHWSKKKSACVDWYDWFLEKKMFLLNQLMIPIGLPGNGSGVCNKTDQPISGNI